MSNAEFGIFTTGNERVGEEAFATRADAMAHIRAELAETATAGYAIEPLQDIRFSETGTDAPSLVVDGRTQDGDAR